MIVRRLFPAVRDRFALDLHGVHGLAHWARVHLHGVAIASAHRLRTDVPALFAFLHDACRENDGSDPEHGPRAVGLAERLRGRCFEVDDEGFGQLCTALDGHSRGGLTADLVVQACWDADRLDLARLGYRVDPARLGTAEGRRAETIARAYRLAEAWRRRVGW
jgi:uncharacterized protein